MDSSSSLSTLVMILRQRSVCKIKDFQTIFVRMYLGTIAVLINNPHLKTR